MNTLQRPLFRAKGGGAFPDLSGDGKVTQKDILIGRGVIERQEGGPAGPMMPPEAMAQGPDPRMVQELEQVQRRNEMVGEEAGAAFVAESLRGIDEAEDFEEFINSIRGNAKPITARRDELATYVGRADADQTPESVLALVQPTFMLTEEGAIDSGIGELLQNITGGVEMMGDSGMPTEMGEGIGGLMMAGQPGPEPVRMRFGGDPADFFEALQEQYPVSDLGDLLEQNRELYTTFLTDPDQLSEDEFQFGLALAQAGARLAGGVGPGGENIADRPFLSQLATVGSDLIQTEGERLGARRKREREIEMLALQSALTQQQGQKEFQQQLTRDRLKSEYDLASKLAVEEAGKTGKTELKVVDGRLAIAKIGPDGELIGDVRFVSALDNDIPWGKLDKEGLNAAFSFVNKEYGSVAEIPAGKQQNFVDNLNLAYAPRIDDRTGFATSEKLGFIPARVARDILSFENVEIGNAMRGLLQRSANMSATPAVEPVEIEEKSAVKVPQGEPVVAPPEEPPEEEQSDLVFIDPDFNLGELYGTGSDIVGGFRTLGEVGADVSRDLLQAEGAARAMQPSPRANERAAAVRELIVRIRAVARGLIEGRLFASTMEEIAANADAIAPFGEMNESKARGAYIALRKRHTELLEEAEKHIAKYNRASEKVRQGIQLDAGEQHPQDYDREGLQNARSLIKKIPGLNRELEAAINSFSNLPPLEQIEPSRFKSPRTGVPGLRRKE